MTTNKKEVDQEVEQERDLEEDRRLAHFLRFYESPDTHCPDYTGLEYMDYGE